MQLALRAALHGCHRELVPPPWQQIPNRVGHQLPVGDVAALGALACGHIDDIRLQRCAWSWCVPEYVGRGGCDSGGGQVCWRQGTWTRHGQQEVKGRVDATWDLRGVAEAASEARSVTWTKASELRPGHVQHCSPVDRPHTRHPLGSQCQSPAPQPSVCPLGGPWTVDKQPGARGGRGVPAGPALHRPALPSVHWLLCSPHTRAGVGPATPASLDGLATGSKSPGLRGHPWTLWSVFSGKLPWGAARSIWC